MREWAGRFAEKTREKENAERRAEEAEAKARDLEERITQTEGESEPGGEVVAMSAAEAEELTGR